MRLKGNPLDQERILWLTKTIKEILDTQGGLNSTGLLEYLNRRCKEENQPELSSNTLTYFLQAMVFYKDLHSKPLGKMQLYWSEKTPVEEEAA